MHLESEMYLYYLRCLLYEYLNEDLEYYVIQFFEK